MHSPGKDEYVWPEKRDEIYFGKNIVCKTEPPVPTKNGLHDCFMILKLKAIYHIKSTDIL